MARLQSTPRVNLFSTVHFSFYRKMCTVDSRTIVCVCVWWWWGGGGGGGVISAIPPYELINMYIKMEKYKCRVSRYYTVTSYYYV